MAAMGLQRDFLHQGHTRHTQSISKPAISALVANRHAFPCSSCKHNVTNVRHSPMYGACTRMPTVLHATRADMSGSLQLPAPTTRNPGGSHGISIDRVPDLLTEARLPEHQRSTSPARTALPYMLILPDIDGVGVTSSKLWPKLAARFNLHVLRMDTQYTGSFNELVDHVNAHLYSKLNNAPPEQPTYLLGDGFGALLAIAVLLTCKTDVINRVVLVNPLTCLHDVPLLRIGPLLASLPAPIMRAAPLAIAPLLGGSPTDLLGHMWAAAKTRGLSAVHPQKLAATAMQALLSALEQLQQLSRHLPPATLAARLQLVDQGLRCIQGRLQDVEQRVMILTGGKDALMPSVDEGRRLARELPRAFVKELPNAGHALLLDPSVDLLSLMQDEGFLVTRRTFTSPVKPGTRVAFGAPGPIELPTAQEAMRAGRDVTWPMRKLCSPVFLSTTADGRVVEGLDALDTSQRPLLFVGNHQLYAMDMNVLVEEVLLRKGVLLRGLAHPALFTQSHPAFKSQHQHQTDSDTDPNKEPAPGSVPAASDSNKHAAASGSATATAGNASLGQQRGNHSQVGPVASAGVQNNAVPWVSSDARRQQQQQQGRFKPFFLGDVYRTFGAVVVSPTAFFKLLAAGEAVLLYPGGVREGFKRKNEKYELFWPEKGEFIRMAARHNAWVVPVSAVGWEDCVDIKLDTDELVKHPWLGAGARFVAGQSPHARDASSELDETFIPPLIAPSTPARLYFLLGQPVQLSSTLCKDRTAADAQYAAIKQTIKDGISWLLQKREQDPYKNVVTRLLYENNPIRRGQRQQAPTFSLEDTSNGKNQRTGSAAAAQDTASVKNQAASAAAAEEGKEDAVAATVVPSTRGERAAVAAAHQQHAGTATAALSDDTTGPHSEDSTGPAASGITAPRRW